MNTKGKHPVAPPPYRPQPVPRVLQTKSAIVRQAINPASRPVAPPVYRPNSVPKVLQAKTTVAQALRPGPLIQLKPTPRVLQSAIRKPQVTQVTMRPPVSFSASSVAKAPPTSSLISGVQRFSLFDVLQLKVTLEKQQGKYKVKGRPRFQSFVRRTLIHKWNQEHPKHTLPLKTNLTAAQLDQCHKVSWSNIRGWVQGYLNKGLTKDKLIELTDSLYHDAKDQSAEWKTMNGMRGKLIQLVEAGTSSLNEVAAAVSQLCSALNSATPNLRLDSHILNISIQDHYDPHVVVDSVTGKYQATPHSQKSYSNPALRPHISDVKHTPTKGERAISSSAASPLSQSNSTPRTVKTFVGKKK